MDQSYITTEYESDYEDFSVHVDSSNHSLNFEQ